MLSDFITCMGGGDLSVLVKDPSKAVSKEELSKAWDNILDEYSDLLKDREQQHIEEVSKQINLLITKRNAINACLYRLSIAYSEEIVNELRKWTLVIEKFNTEDEDAYLRDLQNIKNRNARIEIDIRHLQEEIKRIPKDIEGDKYSFERTLIQLQKHMRHPINKFETTVASYALMVADLMMKAEEVNRQNSTYAK